MDLFWSQIYDLIIKSFVSGEHAIFAAFKKTCIHRSNCFELFGYDVMLDENLKPWLIEINLSPSLACDSPLDMEIKSNLLADTFNLIGIKQYDRKKESENKARNRMKSYQHKKKSLNSKLNNIFRPSSGKNAFMGQVLTLNQLKNKR